MSKEITDRIIPNEVILVGKLRDDNDTSVIDTNLPPAEQLKACLKKFKFTRNTAPNAAAQAAGFLTGKFYQIQMGDPGGEKIKLPNGNTVRRSRKTTRPGYANIFQSNQPTTFEEIKEELLHTDTGKSDGNPDRVELVAGDPNAGKIRLTEYALMGFWDRFPIGFYHHVWTRDEKGALIPFMSNVKQPDGSFKKEHARRNTGEHFVFEDDAENLEGLRDTIRDQVKKWRIETSDNTTENKGEVTTESVKKDEPAKAGEEADVEP